MNKPLRIIITCLCLTGFGNSSSLLANVDSILAICKGNQLSNEERFQAINAYYIAYNTLLYEE